MRFKPAFLTCLGGATLGLVLLSGCGEGQVVTVSPLGREPEAPSTYLAPPEAQAVSVSPGGMRLAGRAAPGARVRLATPEGEVRLTEAGSDGTWGLDLGASSAPQIFGLSMTLADRTVQAEGYQLVLPDGRLVLLRAGTGGVVVQGVEGNRIVAFDFDEEGGAVISGLAPAEAILSVRIDGRTVSTSGRTGTSGRFVLPFGAPVPPGRHQIRVQGEGVDLTAEVDATPARPPTSGAFRATTTAYGLRIDWLTPGGGLQTTLLVQ